VVGATFGRAVSPQSLRSGAAIQAGMAGASVAEVASRSGHSRESRLAQLVALGRRNRDGLGRYLGL
jgi:hypothetical protein